MFEGLAGNARVRLLAVFVGLALWFSIWALIKPPFQAPDENHHALKAYSISKTPWLARNVLVPAHARFLNPLISAEEPYHLRFHPQRSLSRRDIERLKSIEWPTTDRDDSVRVLTSASVYPALYYASTFAAGEALTRLLRLSPYQSFFAYRLVSALLAALLWVWVLHALRQIPGLEKHGGFLVLICTINPMLAFVSSSINPDACFNPLAALVLIYGYRCLVHGEATRTAVAVILLASFAKPLALVYYPALAVATPILMLFVREPRRLLRRSLLLVPGPFLVTYLTFYAWIPADPHGPPVRQSLLEYVAGVPARLPTLFEMFWGRLGWVDYSVAAWMFRVLLLLVLVNVCSVWWRPGPWRNHSFPWFAMLLASICGAGLLAGEFVFLTVTGLSLQGRYFLSFALGFYGLFLHDVRSVRWLTAGYLCWFAVANVHETFVRYFKGDWGLLWQSLPW